MPGRRGWKYNKHDSRLEVYVDGTEILRLDDATPALKVLAFGLDISAGVQVGTGLSVDGGMTVSGTNTFAGNTIVSGNVNLVGTLSVDEKITYSDQLVHASAATKAITGTQTIAISEAGRVLTSDVPTGSVITLPAGTSVGTNFIFVNNADDATGVFTLNPNGVDRIIGNGQVGVSNKDYINTAATHEKGDMISIIADGVSGYYIQELHGTWAAEA